MEDCNTALRYDSINIKAIYRRALAFVGLAENLPAVNLDSVNTKDEIQMLN